MSLEQFGGPVDMDKIDKYNQQVDDFNAGIDRNLKGYPASEQASQLEIDRNHARDLADETASRLDRCVGQIYGSYVISVPIGQTMPEYYEKIKQEKDALMYMAGIKEPVGVSSEDYQKSIKEQLSDNEVKFNLTNKYEANAKFLKSGKFAPGAQVNVRRTSGAMENDWYVQEVNELFGTISVAKSDSERGKIMKTIPIAELGQLNK